MELIPHQRLYRGYQRSRHHQEVTVKDSHEIEDGVEPRDNLARLNCGNMHLRQSETLSQLFLTPAALVARLDQFLTHRLGQTIQAFRL